MRNWLNNNKIYFETFVPLLVSVAALVVALASYNLADRQLELSAIESEPNFYLKEMYLYDPTIKRAYETELRIYNSGADISNFKKQINSFVEVEHYNESGKVVDYISIIGYYGITYNSSDPSGELSLIKGERNNDKYFETYFDFQNLKSDENYGFVFLRLKHATKISYTNKLDEKGVSYFIDNLPVTNEKYLELMNNWNASNMVDIDDLSVRHIKTILTN
ncbi:hypothetical protein AB4393_12335 [Vibrio splendidus]